MKRTELDNAFPETPELFSRRIDQTLQQIQEGKPEKKFALRTAILAAAILLLLSGIAYAVINLGQEWYFNHRFTNFQTNHPEKHQAILENLQEPPTQKNQGKASDIIAFQVVDAAWAKGQGVFTLSVSATPILTDKDELHPLGALNGDGCYDAKPNPDDPDIRTEHWLSTEKGFGTPDQVMLHPDKRLLLLDLWDTFYIGDSDTALPMWSSDQFTTRDGPVMGVFELNGGMMKEQALQEAIKKATTPAGLLPLRFPYKVWTLDNSDLRMLAEGEVNFQVQTK